MHRKAFLILIFILPLFVVLLYGERATGEQRIIYTDKSVDFYGYCDELRIGDLITAYDPDGVLCGQYVVEKEGQYGIVHVYGDDNTSLDVDEGAIGGDVITFYVNGVKAVPTNVNQAIWTKDGDCIRLDF